MNKNVHFLQFLFSKLIKIFMNNFLYHTIITIIQNLFVNW